MLLIRINAENRKPSVLEYECKTCWENAAQHLECIVNGLLCFFCFPQRSFFHRLTGDNKSERFFRVFNDRMKLAQQEIKATMTVNTSDLGSKKKDDEPADKDAPARAKGQGSGKHSPSYAIVSQG